MMPRIMENGSKDIQLQAFILMGKVLLKMSSLNLDTNSNIPREETKESDWQNKIDKKSYQQSFYA